MVGGGDADAAQRSEAGDSEGSGNNGGAAASASGSDSSAAAAAAVSKAAPGGVPAAAGAAVAAAGQAVVAAGAARDMGPARDRDQAEVEICDEEESEGEQEEDEEDDGGNAAHGEGNGGANASDDNVVQLGVNLDEVFAHIDLVRSISPQLLALAGMMLPRRWPEPFPTLAHVLALQMVATVQRLNGADEAADSWQEEHDKAAATLRRNSAPVDPNLAPRDMVRAHLRVDQ